MNTAMRLRSEEHTSELQSLRHLVCRLLLEKKMDAVAAERLRVFFDARLRSPPSEQLLEHIDQAVNVAEIDHVGTGGHLDFFFNASAAPGNHPSSPPKRSPG